MRRIDQMIVSVAFQGIRLEKSFSIRYLRGMKPCRRLLLVFIAYGIALLHTVVPHHHPDAAGRTIISHAGCMHDGSMGFLQMIFSTDLGYGHLETFKKGGDTEINLAASVTPLEGIIPSPVFLNALSVGRNAAFNGDIGKFHKQLLLFSSAHFRAPPVSASSVC